MASALALQLAAQVWTSPSLALKVLDNDITETVAEMVDNILMSQSLQPEAQLTGIVVQAMTEAAVNGELSQFKMAFTPVGMVEKCHVRIIVIPELMDCERQNADA